MVHRGKGKVRQAGQKEASSTKGAVPKDEDNHSVPECQPEIVKAKQDNVRSVVREERCEVSPPEVRLDGATITDGSYWYHQLSHNLVKYSLIDNKWIFSVAYLWEIKNSLNWCAYHNSPIKDWTAIQRAIKRTELIPVSPEKVTLTILTGTNHCAPIER